MIAALNCMKLILHFFTVIMVMALASYLVRLLLSVDFCYDCISNSYEEIFLYNRSFVAQGFLSGLAVSTYVQFTKKSYESSFTAMLVFAAVWFTLASLRLGDVDLYSFSYKIVPFLVGAASGMFTFNYAAMYLTSLGKRR